MRLAHDLRTARGSSTTIAGAWLLAALVVAAPLGRGGVDLPVQLALAGLAAVALLLVSRGSERAPLLALPLLLAVAWGALQALPLPFLGAVSRDPPATGRDLALGVAMLLAFTAAWAVAGTRRRRDLVLASLGVAGLAVALVALGSALLGLGPLLEPRVPFVNPNHLAGLLALTAFPVLGLALRRRGQARLLWLMGFVLVVAPLFLSLSRGGIGAFFGGAAVFLALASRRLRAPGMAPHPWRWAALTGLTAALGVVAYLALEPVLRELSTLRNAADESKLEMWRPALAMIRDHPLAGIGRGAFATVFPAYKSEPAQVTFAYLENEWLQPLLDLGAPAGLLLVGTLGLVWLRAARRRDLSSAEVGLLAGTAAVAAQNLVDFSLEFAGVGLPFVVALGLLTRGEWPARLAWRRLAGVAAGLLLVALAGAAFWRAHPTDRDGLAVLLAPDAAAAELAALEAARWHPADYLPVASAGIRWVEEDRCAKGLPWLSRAMALNPTAPEPHLFAGRCLAAAGQDAFARREYRLAFLYGRGDALREAADRYQAVDDLLQVVPLTGDGLLALGGLLSARSRPDDVVRVLRVALDDLLDARALLPLAGALLAAGELEEALTLALRRTLEKPLDPAGWQLAAAVLSRQGEEDEARQVLQRGLSFLPGSPPLVEALVQRSLSARRPAEARRLAEGMAVRTPAELAQKQLLIAATLAAQGRLGEAIERARSASAALPASPGPLMTVAAYCQQAGRLDDAIAAVERAAALPGQAREAYQARLDELAAARAAQSQRRMSDQLLK